MNKPKVFIVQKIPVEVENYIGKFCDYEKWEQEDKISRYELLKRLYDKDGVILSDFIIDNELLNNAPRLKVVSNISVGYNNFDLEAMKERCIIGTNTPGVLDDTVADLVFGLILAVSRRIPELDRYVKEGKWNESDYENRFGIDVHHATLGIIGMGRIGDAVAKRAKLGFDMEVLYHNRKRKIEVEKSLGVKYCDLIPLLKESDYILLMTPLTRDTYHFIDFEEFNIMKNTAIFINVSRGQTVNEQALIEALQNNQLAGAGLDVYDKEPISPSNALLKMPNVVTVPHIGSATEKTEFDMAMLAASNLVATLTGKSLSNVVPELKNIKLDKNN